MRNTNLKAKSISPKRNLTEAPLVKSIISISIPLVITNLLFTIYQIIDAFWVGQLGEVPVAGVSLTFPIFFIVSSIAFAISSTGSILIAQHKGKNDSNKVNYYSNQTISLLTIIGLLVSIIGFFISPQLVSFFGAEKEVTVVAAEYMGILFIGMIFFFFYNSVSTAIRSIGEVRLLIEVAVITTIINFVLDPVLMLGLFGAPKLGAGGVAWATTITNAISAILALYWLSNNKHILRLEKKYLIISRETINDYLKLGVPALIEFLSRSFSSIIVTFIVAWYGTTIIAAYGIGSRIASFILIPSFGISLAISTIVGQNLGAKKIDRVKEAIKKGSMVAFSTLFLLGIIASIFSTQIAQSFVIGSGKVVEEAAIFIILYSLSLAFIAVQVVITSSYRAAGYTKIAMGLSIGFVIIQITMILLFALILGEKGLWIGHAAANLTSTILTYLYYKLNPITKSGI